jgi:hypothetical protein
MKSSFYYILKYYTLEYNDYLEKCKRLSLPVIQIPLALLSLLSVLYSPLSIFRNASSAVA